MTLLSFRRRDLLTLSLMMFGLAVRALPATGTVPGSVPGRQLWGIDYGAATDPSLARRYDLLVLEPDFDRPLDTLRGKGSRLLGYISLGEVNMARPFAADLAAAGALGGANPNWKDARFADLRHPAWQAMVLDQLVPAILRKGYDGIFMDTLDNAEALERRKQDAQPGMVAGAVDLVRALRARFPDMLIMMNRGYALLPDVVSHIDIVLAEAMASRWNFVGRRYELTPQQDWEWQAAQLHAAARGNPDLALMTLDYWDPADHATVASLYARERAAGFQPYVSTLALDRLIPEPRP